MLGVALFAIYAVVTLASLGLIFAPPPEASGWGAHGDAVIRCGGGHHDCRTFCICCCRSWWRPTTVGWAKPCGAWAGSSRLQFRHVTLIFGATLVLVVLATAASILATAALGLIAFVPFVGLAALPLQLMAWVVRGLVFEFIGLTALVAYLRVYRLTREEPGARASDMAGPPDGLPDVPLERRARLSGVGDSPRGCPRRESARPDLLRAGLSGSRALPVGRAEGDHDGAPRSARRQHAAVRRDARLSAPHRGSHSASQRPAASRPAPKRSSSRPDRSKDWTSSVACSSTPAMSCWWSSRPTAAPSLPSTTCRRRSSGSSRTPRASPIDALDATIADLARRRPAPACGVRDAELPESRRAAHVVATAPGPPRRRGAARAADRRGRSVRHALFRRHHARRGHAADQGRRRRGESDLSREHFEDARAGTCASPG